MRLRWLKVLTVLAVFVAASGFSPYGTNDLAALTVPATYTGNSGAPLSYRLFVPAIPDTATNGVPLILFLHGSGECGTNNLAQLLHGVGGLVWWSRHREPAIVVAPQAPPMTAWSPVFFNRLTARMPITPPPMMRSSSS